MVYNQEFNSLCLVDCGVCLLNCDGRSSVVVVVQHRRKSVASKAGKRMATTQMVGIAVIIGLEAVLHHYFLASGEGNASRIAPSLAS